MARDKNNPRKIITVNNKPALSILDTGCSLDAIIKKHYVKNNQYTGCYVDIQSIFDSVERLRVARVYVKTDQYKGYVFAAVRNKLPYDIILGGNFINKDIGMHSYLEQPASHVNKLRAQSDNTFTHSPKYVNENLYAVKRNFQPAYALHTTIERKEENTQNRYIPPHKRGYNYLTHDNYNVIKTRQR